MSKYVLVMNGEFWDGKKFVSTESHALELDSKAAAVSENNGLHALIIKDYGTESEEYV